MPLTVALLFLPGCVGFPFFGREAVEEESHQEAGAPEEGQAVVEFQNARYDGRALSGRVLVGAVRGSIKLDRRLIENVSVTLKSVVDCDTGKPAEYLFADFFPPPTQEGDVLVLTSGYWYGSDVHFPLFDPLLNGKPGPACIEVVFSFEVLSGAEDVKFQVRATQRALEGPDAGTPVMLDGGNGSHF